MKIKKIVLLTFFSTNFLLSKLVEFPKINIIKQVPSDPLKRLSSYPYLSGDTFRGYCDFVIDKTNRFIETEKIKNGDTIFVEAQQKFLDIFFSQVHPNIKAKYILVTHNSDKSKFEEFKEYLDDNNIIAWFGVNLTLEHEKAFPIPIGIANRYWKHGNISIIENTMKNLPEKDILLYMNFKINTNKIKRQAIFDIFKNKSFCHKAANRPFNIFINDLARSEFVISPPGNGIDCHRAWEALYLGGVPIIETSKINRLFAGLPVIIIDDWNKITPEYLTEQYQKIKNKIKTKEYTLEKIFADYWFKKISEFKEKAQL